jgi:hypothetical protein
MTNRPARKEKTLRKALRRQSGPKIRIAGPDNSHDSHADIVWRLAIVGLTSAFYGCSSRIEKSQFFTNRDDTGSVRGRDAELSFRAAERPV